MVLVSKILLKMVSFRRVYLISKKKRKKCSIFLNRIHDRKDIKIIILFWRQKDAEMNSFSLRRERSVEASLG